MVIAFMTIRVGWITSEFPQRPSRRSVWLKSGAMLTMRFRNIALWLNRHGFQNTFYRADQSYDAVVIIKNFEQDVSDETRRLQQREIPVIFDANVNYYYIWGNYPDPQTRPTIDQRRRATQITQQAQHVIADSEYLRDVVSDFNHKVTWVPDNVWPLLFRPAKHRTIAGQLRLIWSGIAFKADELRLLLPIFAQMTGLELWIVSDARPAVVDTLEKVIPVRCFRYSDWRYAWLLGQADAIISPRDLNNGYNLGHTEYKITLGMARNLPAIASPQPAYVTALRDGGGMICYTDDDWIQALTRLRDDVKLRIQLGNQARARVAARYSTPVVAAQISSIIKQEIANAL